MPFEYVQRSLGLPTAKHFSSELEEFIVVEGKMRNKNKLSGPPARQGASASGNGPHVVSRLLAAARSWLFSSGLGPGVGSLTQRSQGAPPAFLLGAPPARRESRIDILGQSARTDVWRKGIPRPRGRHHVLTTATVLKMSRDYPSRLEQQYPVPSRIFLMQRGSSCLALVAMEGWQHRMTGTRVPLLSLPDRTTPPWRLGFLGVR